MLLSILCKSIAKISKSSKSPLTIAFALCKDSELKHQRPFDSLQNHYDAVAVRINVRDLALATIGQPEERQTDSGNNEGPVNSKEIVVGEEEGEELSDEDGSNCSEFLKVSFLDYDLEKQPPVIYTKDNSSDIFPEFLPKKRKTKRNSKTAGGKGRRGYHIFNEENLNRSDDEDTGPRYTKQKYNSISMSDNTEFSAWIKTISSDQAVEEYCTKGVGLKREVIGKERERWSTEVETGLNKLLLYDPSQHFPRIEEVQVVQAPPPEPNGSQDGTENGESNAEGLEDIPDEEEQLYEVDSSAMVDERHDPGETSPGWENDGDRTQCTRNIECVAAGGADDECAVGDRCLQSGEGVASRDAP